MNINIIIGRAIRRLMLWATMDFDKEEPTSINMLRQVCLYQQAKIEALERAVRELTQLAPHYTKQRVNDCLVLVTPSFAQEVEPDEDTNDVPAVDWDAVRLPNDHRLAVQNSSTLEFAQFIDPTGMVIGCISALLMPNATWRIRAQSFNRGAACEPAEQHETSSLQEAADYIVACGGHSYEDEDFVVTNADHSLFHTPNGSLVCNIRNAGFYSRSGATELLTRLRDIQNRQHSTKVAEYREFVRTAQFVPVKILLVGG